MPEEKIASLPKPLIDLPKPEKNLPLPEKELTAHATEYSVDKTENSKSSFILKSFLLGILFVILIVLIGGGSFLMGHKTKSENKQVVTTKVSAPSPTLSSKTYVSPDGYEFKYPSNLIEFTPPARTGVSRLNAVFMGVPDSDQSILFESYPNSEKLTTIEWWNKNASVLLLSQASDSSTTPIKSSEVKLSEKNIGDNLFLVVNPKNGPGPQYLITNGKTIVNIRPGFLNDAYKILFSFKFTNSELTIDNPEIQADAEKELGSNYKNVKINKVFRNNYALGNAGSIEYGGIEFLVHLENGKWKVIWRGNEAPGCSNFKNYPDLPEGLCINY